VAHVSERRAPPTLPRRARAQALPLLSHAVAAALGPPVRALLAHLDAALAGDAAVLSDGSRDRAFSVASQLLQKCALALMRAEGSAAADRLARAPLGTLWGLGLGRRGAWAPRWCEQKARPRPAAPLTNA